VIFHRLWCPSWMAALVWMAALAALTPGCASPPPIATPEEIAQAEANDDLEAVFDRVALALAGLPPDSESAKITQANLDEIGSRLGAKLEATVTGEINNSRLEDGHIPLEALDKVREQLDPMRRWDSERFARLSQEIDSEASATDSAIEDQRAKLADLTGDQALDRLRILENLGELSGAGSTQQSRYVGQRLEILEDMRQRANQALAAENLDEAQRVLKILQQAEPDDSSVGDQLVVVDERVFERDFWTSLERGDPDGAYQAFSTLAASSSFAVLRPRLESSAEKMSKYFAAEAGAAVDEGNLEAAYRWFVQSREIDRTLGRERGLPSPQETAFLTRMHAAYENAIATDRPGLAWGCLNVIEEIGSMSPGLRRQLRETRELVVTAATRRLTAYPFDESEGAGEFGEAVASKVIQYLFESIPDDLRIIEREQLEDIMRERELKSGESLELASADFLIQGDILEAKVDGAQQKGRKTQRVITGVKRDRNPDYEGWLALPEKLRGERPQPPTTIEVEVVEDITFDVEVHRKVGIFSTAYRVVDAQSAKVIFADSVREKVVYEDESREGIELGDFKMEFKLVDLPSDVEILTQLADAVSKEIGTRIANHLKDPELEYARQAEEAATERNYMSASENAAYAMVLFERKNGELGDLPKQLRTYSVEASPALLD
jgi:hypothetical protein